VNGEPVPYNGGRFYLTAGEVRRQGLELALNGYFAGGFSARFAGTFSANSYDRYVVDSTYLGVPGASAVLDGNRVAGLPGRVINAALRWDRANPLGIALEVGAQHNSDYFADDRNAVNVPGFTIYRASIEHEGRIAANTLMRVTLALENLGNAKYVGSAFINPDYTGGAPLVYEPGLPRAMVLGVSFRRAR
jgi:outer membrane receptor protein involved in Fe transport